MKGRDYGPLWQSGAHDFMTRWGGGVVGLCDREREELESRN